MQKQLPPLLNRLKDELPGFLAAAVVNADDGLSLADLSIREEISADAASAYLASIVKANRRAIKLLAGGQITDDIIISTGEYHFIIRLVIDMPFFLFVMTERTEWLGRTKMIMEKFQQELGKIMQSEMEQGSDEKGE